MRVDEITTTETVLKGADYIVVDSEADGTRKLAMQAIIDAGAAATILWRWNETDATQFRVALDENGAGGVVLSKVAGADGPRLRVAFPTKTNGAPDLTVITLADLVLPLVQTDVRRYVFKFRVVGFNTAKDKTQWYSVGFALCCNDGVDATFYGQVLTSPWNTADRTGQVEAGAKTLAGGTPGWGGTLVALLDTDDDQLCVPFAADITQRHVAASPPDWRGSLSVGVPISASNQQYYANCSRKAVTAATTAVGAGWNTETFDTVGIAFLGTTGTDADHYFEIDQIRVETHPMDL